VQQDLRLKLKFPQPQENAYSAKAWHSDDLIDGMLLSFTPQSQLHAQHVSPTKINRLAATASSSAVDSDRRSSRLLDDVSRLYRTHSQDRF
jgi:hypothetical protein